MKVFTYSGTSADGTPCSDELEAADIDAARKVLTERGISVDTLQERSPGPLAGLSPTESAAVNARVSELVAAGLPLGEGLRAAAGEFEEPGLLRRVFLLDWLQGFFGGRSSRKISRALGRVANRVDSGESLAQILQTTSAPAEVKAILDSGIDSQSTAMAVGEYSAFAETSMKMRMHVMFLFAYPLLIASAGLAALGAFFCFLVPPVREVIEGFGVETPWATRVVFSISEPLISVGPTIVIATPLVLGLLVVVFFTCWTSASNSIARRLPLLGTSFRDLDLSRSTHLLAVVLRHESPMPTALRAAGTASVSQDITSACDELALTVENGHKLPDFDPALAGLPLSFLQLAQTDSDRDIIADALHAIAGALEQRARTIMSLLASAVQPFVVIVVGGTMTVCFYSLLFPITRLLGGLV